MMDHKDAGLAGKITSLKQGKARLSSFTTSSGAMFRIVPKVVLGTEIGIIRKLTKENPGKNLFRHQNWRKFHETISERKGC